MQTELEKIKDLRAKFNKEGVEISKKHQQLTKIYSREDLKLRRKLDKIHLKINHLFNTHAHWTKFEPLEKQRAIIKVQIAELFNDFYAKDELYQSKIDHLSALLTGLKNWEIAEKANRKKDNKR